MTPLDDLIAAVESGNVSTHHSWSAVAVLGKTSADRADLRGYAGMAFRGSLDAALRLHDALLPGWDYLIDNLKRVKLLAFVQDDGGPRYTGESLDPARAWLLAILRAVKAKEAGND